MTDLAHLTAAYIERRPRKTWLLVLVAGPCNGPDYAQAPRLPFSNKREARAYCDARGIQPLNF